MYKIEVDTSRRILRLIKDGILVKQYPVAIGKASTPTPLGHWIITYKGLWGEQFGGHFMRINVPYGIYGIHGTNKPWTISKAASEGCIRMYNNDAKELYDLVPIGTAVDIF